MHAGKDTFGSIKWQKGEEGGLSVGMSVGTICNLE